MGHRSSAGLSQTGISDDKGNFNSDIDMMGRQDQVKSSRPGSSRPTSSRPVSSRNRIGSGVGKRQSFEGKNKKGVTASMEVTLKYNEQPGYYSVIEKPWWSSEEEIRK